MTLQDVAPALPSVGTLLAYGGALLTSFGLSKVKGLDTAVTNSPVFRKVQPLVTLAGAAFLPWLGAKLGVQLDPGSLAAAPLATVVTVVGAELLSILRRSTS